MNYVNETIRMFFAGTAIVLVALISTPSIDHSDSKETKKSNLNSDVHSLSILRKDLSEKLFSSVDESKKFPPNSTSKFDSIKTISISKESTKNLQKPLKSSKKVNTKSVTRLDSQNNKKNSGKYFTRKSELDLVFDYQE